MTIPDQVLTAACGAGGFLFGGGVVWGALNQVVKQLREIVTELGKLPEVVARHEVRHDYHDRAEDRLEREIGELRARTT